MKLRVVLVVVVGLLAAVGAAATNKGPDVAEQLVRTTIPVSQYTTLMATMKTQIVMGLRAQGVDTSDPATVDKINRLVSEAYSYDDLVKATVKVVNQYYTKAEMQKLMKFYRSPVGKKSIEVMPKITTESTTWSVKQFQAAMPKIMEAMKPHTTP